MKFAMLPSTACSFPTTITGNPTRNFVKLIRQQNYGCNWYCNKNSPNNAVKWFMPGQQGCKNASCQPATLPHVIS